MYMYTYIHIHTHTLIRIQIDIKTEIKSVRAGPYLLIYFERHAEANWVPPGVPAGAARECRAPLPGPEEGLAVKRLRAMMIMDPGTILDISRVM